MSFVNTVVVTTTLLGSALIGGIFFAFSNFVMKALAQVPTEAGIKAMQSINVVVLNPVFLGALVGTAVLSLLVAGLAISNWSEPASVWYLSGALLYVVGTFLVTGIGNVPLNDQLADVTATDLDAVLIWEHYLRRWTSLNTVRSVAALIAAMLFIIGLVR